MEKEYIIKAKKIECEIWTVKATSKVDAVEKFHFGEATYQQTDRDYTIEIALPE